MLWICSLYREQQAYFSQKNIFSQEAHFENCVIHEKPLPPQHSFFDMDICGVARGYLSDLDIFYHL